MSSHIRLHATILQLEMKIADLERYLPYADGLAYSKDKQRIREAREELSYWKDVLSKVEQMENAA